MKVYAVLDKNYDYNDEYYYRAGNGNVVGIFASKEAASAHERTEGVKKFRADPEIYMGEEGYSFLEDDNGRELIQSSSDDEVYAIMEKNDVEVFEIQPIEITDEFIRTLGK